MKGVGIPFASLGYDPEEIYRIMGYGTNTPGRRIRQRTDQLWQIASGRVFPSYYYEILQGEVHPRSLVAGPVAFDTGALIAGLMKNSLQFAVFVATAGNGLGEWIAESQKKQDWAEIYMIDCIGSYIAEKAGDYMESELEKQLGGIKHTHRFSPGYCGWDIKEQQKLFSLLPPGACSVTLHESCLMEPVKSISGIIGIGEQVQTKRYGCVVCESDSCYKRKIKK